MKKYIKLFEEIENDDLSDVFDKDSTDYLSPEPELISTDSSKHTITVKFPSGKTSTIVMDEISGSRELIDDGGGGQYETAFEGEDDEYYYEIGGTTDNYDNVEFDDTLYWDFTTLEDKRKADEESKIKRIERKAKDDAEFKAREQTREQDRIKSGLSEEEYKFKEELESNFERLKEYLEETPKKAPTTATTKFLVITDMTIYDYEDRIKEPYSIVYVVLGKTKEDAIERYNKAIPDKKSNTREVVNRYAEELSKYEILMKYDNLLPDFMPIHGNIPGLDL